MNLIPTWSLLTVLFLCSTFTVSAQSFIPDAKLVSTDRDEGDFLGGHVAIDGNYAIVGALGDDENEAGQDFMEQAGAAYIFERAGTNSPWQAVQKLVASDRAAGAEFGYRVAIDGNYAIVTTWRETGDANGENNLDQAGAAYVFERLSGNTWTEVQKIVPSDRALADRFGRSVSLQANVALIGAPDEDEDPNGENSLAVAGSVYVFVRNNDGVWEETQKLVASDRASDDLFGYSVDMDGDYAIIGAYAKNETSTTDGSLTQSVGAVYIFQKDNNNNWTEVQKLIGTNRGQSYFYGWSVGINGNQAVVGASEENITSDGTNIGDAGAVYTYRRNEGGVWLLEARLTLPDPQSDDILGSAVAIQEDVIIAGAPGEDEDEQEANSMDNAGAAVVFTRSEAGEWSMQQKLVPGDRFMNDRFGRAVALSGNTALVGSPFSDTDADGMANIPEAGAAYTFERVVDASVSHTFLQTPVMGPNPTQGRISIDWPEPMDQVSIQLYDMTGRLLQTASFEHTQHGSFTVPGPAGTYLLHLSTPDGRKGSWKVVKI